MEEMIYKKYIITSECDTGYKIKLKVTMQSEKASLEKTEGLKNYNQERTYWQTIQNKS